MIRSTPKKETLLPIRLTAILTFIDYPVKREQDYRFGVPVSGLRTLEIMAEHNIKTAVLKSVSTIMVEKEMILAEAKRHKTQIIGF